MQDKQVTFKINSDPMYTIFLNYYFNGKYDIDSFPQEKPNNYEHKSTVF